jgi:hypothetical protein
MSLLAVELIVIKRGGFDVRPSLIRGEGLHIAATAAGLGPRSWARCAAAFM